MQRAWKCSVGHLQTGQGRAPLSFPSLLLLTVCFVLIFSVFLKEDSFTFILCVCVFYMLVCAPCVCLLPKEARRGCQNPWNWNYRCF